MASQWGEVMAMENWEASMPAWPTTEEGWRARSLKGEMLLQKVYEAACRHDALRAGDIKKMIGPFLGRSD